MTFRLRRAIAFSIFVAGLAVYVYTSYPGVSYWTSGEYAAAAMVRGNTHAPGAPLFVLLAHLAGRIPFAADPALAMNLFSAFISGFTVMLVYLIGTRLIASGFRKGESMAGEALVVHGGAILGALGLAFASTFWSNATAVSPRALEAFLAALILWLSILWYESDEEGYSFRYPLFILFAVGLSIGVHPLNALFILPAVVIGYFKNYYFSPLFFALYCVLGTAAALAITALPAGVALVSGTFLGFLVVFSGAAFVTLGVCVFALLLSALFAWTLQRATILVAGLAFVCLIAGYSVSLLVPLRGFSGGLPNFAAPSTHEEYIAYASTGSVFSAPSVLERRWDADPASAATYAAYESDIEFLWRYQTNHVFLRYLFWNVVGRAGDATNAPFQVISDRSDGPLGGLWTTATDSFPNRYYGIPFVIGLAGLFTLLSKNVVYGLAACTLFLADGIGQVVFANPSGALSVELDSQYLESLLAFFLWIGVGSAFTLRFFIRNMETGGRAVAVVLLVCFALAVPGNFLLSNWPEQNARRDRGAGDFAYNLLQSCEPGAILFTQGDNDTYPLWYTQTALGIRRDVTVVNAAMLNAAWYGKALKQGSATGAAPLRLSLSDSDIEGYAKADSAVLLRLCSKNDQERIRIPVPPTTMLRFMKERTPKKSIFQPDSVWLRKVSGEMLYTSRAAFPIGLGSNPVKVRYYRKLHDVLIEDILRSAKWKRPVYFAVSCLPSTYNGLEDFLRLEGLAYRVTPVAFEKNNYIGYAAMKEVLNTRVGGYHREPKRGLLARMPEEMPSYKNPVFEGYIANYRNAYVRFAFYQSHYLHDHPSVVLTLKRMEEVFPEAVYPMEYRYAFDIALLYHDAGAKKECRAIMRRVERESLSEIKRDPYSAGSVRSPYRYLLELYLLEKRYGEAVALLERLAQRYPDAEDVCAKREEVLRRMSEQDNKL